MVNKSSTAVCLAAIAAAALLWGCGGARARFESHMRRGQSYFAHGDLAKANIEFRNAMQIEPKDPEALLMAARAAERQGRLRSAVGLYRSVIELAPDNKDARAGLGEIYDGVGQTKLALQVIGPALAKHPNDADLLTIRGAARFQAGDHEGGFADAARAVRLDPKNERAVALLAGLYRDDGQLPRAAALLRTTLERLPGSTSLREVLVDVDARLGRQSEAQTELERLIELEPAELRYRSELASLYLRANSLDAAQKVLEDAVHALPHSDAAKLDLADFIATHRNPQDGAKALRVFIAKAPDDDTLRLGLGALLEQVGAKDEAIEAYREIVLRDERRPGALVARDHIARIELVEGRLDEARKQVAQVLESSPRDDEALVLRGTLSLGRHDPTAAIADFRAALRDAPNSSEVNQLLADALVAQGEPALAADQLRSAIQNAPADVGLREALVRMYLDRKDLAAARAAAEEFKTAMPQSPEAYYVAGIVAQVQKRLDDSEREYERAFEIQPSLAPLKALTRLQLARGEAARAIANLEGVVARNPKSALALEMLGEVYLADKDYPHAAAALSRAIAADPSWEDPYRNLAVCKAAENDIAGAIAAYQAGIRAAEDPSQLVAGLASYYLRDKRYDDAIALYDGLYRRDPHSRFAASNLALLLATYKTDRSSLDRARDLTSGFASASNAAMLDASGWVSFKLGELQQAMPILERAAQHAPDSKVIQFHLAMAELEAGKRDRARADLERALAGSASFPGADQARSELATLTSKAG